MERIPTIKEDVRFLANIIITGKYSAKELTEMELKRIDALESLYGKQIDTAKNIINNHISTDSLSLMKKIDLTEEIILELILAKVEGELNTKGWNTDDKTMLDIVSFKVEKAPISKR